MLDATLKTQLSELLTRLVNPVEIVLTTDNSIPSREIQTLTEEINRLSSKVSVRDTSDAVATRTPSLSIAPHHGSARITFAGVPMGHEFTSLVLALLQTSGYAPKISAEQIDDIRSLKFESDLFFETYISLSCQVCPEVVQALNAIAALHPQIHHTMIDGALFQEEVTQKQIMAVPSVYLNGQLFGQGHMTIEDILAKLDQNVDARTTEKIMQKEPFDMLIIGGGPAAAAAAIYAARKGIRTGVVAERFGGQIMDTLAIENFISIEETQGPKLGAALEHHVRTYDVDIMNRQRAQALQKTDSGVAVTLTNGATLNSKAVVIATGARWREMNVPGEQEYRGRGVAYCPHCDGPLFKNKRIAVIGGGNSGVEAAIDLAGIVAHVTLLEFGETLRADAVLQHKLLSLSNVHIITQAQTTEVLGDNHKVIGLSYRDRVSGDMRTIELEGIFVQIGLLPNTDWLKDTLHLSERGEIQVDAQGATSLPGVYAAGDVTTVPYKQIIIAMGEGAKAALGAFDYLIRQ